MKKYICLLTLLVIVFLLFACVSSQVDQASSTWTSYPAPIYTPAASVPESSVPDTEPATSPPETEPATSTPATSVLATTPTTPLEPPARFYLSTDWVTDREIVPFEERFAENVPFGYANHSWLVETTRYPNKFLEYRLMINPTYFFYPIIIMEQRVEEDELLYEVPIPLDRLTDLTTLSSDGRWSYFSNNNKLCKLELLTGELTTLAKKNESDIYWEVQACGKDTVCIFQLDAQRNLRIFFRDLHSDAEKTLYEGILPQSSPYDLTSEIRGLYFSAPSTTLGTVSWQMMNPAFYAVLQEELANPDSPFQHHHQEDYSKYWEDPENYSIHLATCPGLCDAIQKAYNIPYHIKYTYDPVTGTLTEDYGIIDSCFYGTGQGCNHFDYEITKKETPEILDVAPVAIPNFNKLTGDQPFEDFEAPSPCFFSDFGYSYGYWRADSYINKLTDIPVTDMATSNEYFYCITLEGTILQLDRYGSICHTIYTSENELRDLNCGSGYIYFIDGSTIICIDETNGTWRPILKTTLKEIYISGEMDGGLYFGIRQGLYCQEYRFHLDTGELIEESYT